MTKALVLLPSIFKRRTDICVNSMASGFRDRLLVVDNTKTNLGVAASWNIGARMVLDHQLDWLVVLSAGVMFGWHGGLDFLDALEADNVSPCLEAGDGLGWHLIGFRRETLQRVGIFDEQFFAYSEDNEWSIRFQRVFDCDSHAPDFVGPLWPKVPVDAELAEVAHGIKRGGAVVDLEGMRELCWRKWGRNEEYRFPYDDKSLPLDYVGPPPVRHPGGSA